VGKIRLRTRFLLSLLALSTGLTSAMLLVVRYRVEKQEREAIREDLHNSVRNYESFERLREATLTHTAVLVADMPNLRTLMTRQNKAAIQNGSQDIWGLTGSDLFVLAGIPGDVLAFQSSNADFTLDAAQESLRASLKRGNVWDWWFHSGRLYQIWVQPVYSDEQSSETLLGFLVIGQEVSKSQARNFSNVASSEAVFRYGNEIAASTLSAEANGLLEQQFREGKGDQPGTEQEIQIGSERYLGTTVRLSYGVGTPVSLSVLKSFDRATTFLKQLNRVLLILGFVSVLAGTVLAFLLSKTITKPLARLVTGLHAFEKGDSSFPLDASGGDEVAEVTAAFDRMRANLQKTENEQKQLEQRLRQAHKMEAVGRLAGGVAHDFNNLLMIVSGHCELLSARIPAGEPDRNNVEQIQKAADRAVSMTRQLLAFSRMQVLEPRVIDLNAVIADMGKMLARLIGEDIEYTFTPDPKLVSVKADPGQIGQVIMNLVVNSRDAMPKGGSITVRTRNAVLDRDEARKRHPMQPGEYGLLSVTDTGLGMDEETKAHIFEPFFTTKGVGKGTGLGLATVYGIVKQSGGFIWVESAPGKGTTFEIYLPHGHATKMEDAKEIKPAAIFRGKETILVVEDEAAVRELASEFLRSAGYSVLEAKNGAEALETIAQSANAIHLVLADMIMPRMGGAEMADRLKKERPELKVLFMSGYSEHAGVQSNQISPQAILAKPFSIATLIGKVREALSGLPASKASEAEKVQR
jgi:signal transduction histidine kinase/ActR/RegA family two-component response regulator